MLWLLNRWVGRETGLPPVLGKELVFNINIEGWCLSDHGQN